MNTIKDMIRWIDNNDAYKLVKYVDSHDEAANGKSRLHQEIAGYSQSGFANDATYWSKKKNIIGHALAVFSPGIPMFLQGDECMTKKHFMDGSDMVYNFNETYANSKYTGIVTAFGDINRLKRNWNNDTRGLKGSAINVFHVNDKDNVIAFHRWDRGGTGDDVLVLVNLGNTDFDSYNIGVPRSGNWYCRFNSDSTQYDEAFGNFGCKTTHANSGHKDGLDYNMNVEVPKLSTLVYSQ
jgi:1,4-alpha-glucan branching enzyme